MLKYFIAFAALSIFFITDASASDAGQIAGEATGIVTDVMRAIFEVLVEFFGAILDEIVRAVKEIF